MYKGQEYSVVINENIADKDDFTYRTFHKAMYALDDIVKRANKQVIPTRENLLVDTLYRYSQNMIVFSGQRGQGKTSAMLSFSKTLADSGSLQKIVAQEQLTNLEDCSFLAMSPIDPTILEGGQHLLALVLSRMLAYSEQQWQKNTDYCSRFHDHSAEQNELLRLYQECLNGINAIKGNHDGIIKSLSDIHKISDSALLKHNFFKLTEQLLNNAFPSGTLPGKKRFLILQFDDTDFRIARGYEIMDEIRKYLTIPNMIILMATDTDLLREVLTQHYVSEFKENLNQKLIDAEELREIGGKYLAKLVPPVYTAYMSHLDEEIRDQRERITLQYMDKDGEKPINLISRAFGVDEETLSKFSFQDVVLRYIYKKTHLVFAAHSAYMNNIIPTTLRGLAQLLSLLNSMEVVPEISNDDVKDTRTLVERLKKQVPVLQNNLHLFEVYFMNDWIQAKLDTSKIRMIQKLAEQAPGQCIPYIYNALCEYYKVEDGAKHSHACDDYSDLEELICALKETHRQPKDHYFFFAVHTVLTIKNNKTILKIKRNTCEKWTEDNSGALVFDYLQEESSLPKHFYLPANEYYLVEADEDTETKRALVKSLNQKTMTSLRPHEELGKRHYSYWFKEQTEKRKGKVRHTFSFMGLLTSALSPEPVFREGSGEAKTLNQAQQQQMYHAQELACCIAANYDVREKIRKCFQGDRICRPSGRSAQPDIWTNSPGSNTYFVTIDSAFKCVIFPEIAGINTPAGCETMIGCFDSEMNIINVLRFYIPYIRSVLIDIDAEQRTKNDHEQEMNEGFVNTQRLQSVLADYHRLAQDYIRSKNHNAEAFLTAAQRIFSNADRTVLKELTELSSALAERLADNGNTMQSNMTSHAQKLSNFCKRHGILYDTIRDPLDKTNAAGES